MSATDFQYRHNIESTFGDRCHMALEVVFRAGNDTSSFSRIDAFGAASEIRTAAQANFDERDDGAIAHHEIDLAMSTAVVSPQQAQALIGEMPAGELFGPGPACRGGAGDALTGVRASDRRPVLWACLS